MTDALQTDTVKTFTYCGLTCTIKHTYIPGRDTNWYCGYMAGPIHVDSDDHADTIADAHGGFTFFEEGDGIVTLGFDTGHHFDGPWSQNPEYVEKAIMKAVDSLHDAGVIEAVTTSTYGKFGFEIELYEKEGGA